MHESAPGSENVPFPYLEYFPAPRSRPSQRVLLDDFPFLIGRSIAANFTLSDTQVSSKHALVERAGECFRIRDLGSTNGTFVNGTRITEAVLVHDDVLHLAREEFRFVCQAPVAGEDSILIRTVPAASAHPASIVRGNQHLKEMLAWQEVRIIYQPIVRLTTREPLGYEALACGTHSELSIKPVELLRLAEQCGQAAALSQLFRLQAAQDAMHLPEDRYLFVNLHPAELTNEGLLDSLQTFREQLNPERPVVIEIPETAVTDLQTIRLLQENLKARGFLVAYDDFGAGQARFMELTEVPPDFIKLDMQLIRNIHQSGVRQHLIAAFNQVGAQLDVQIIAEGIETREEAQVCHDLGCHFGQGFWFGRPTSVMLLLDSHQSTCAIDLSPLPERLDS